jgi:Protein of unknown function (DUF2637)
MRTPGRRGRAAGTVLDSGPVVVLALIAGAGSFTHIRDTATQHGQRGPMAWAIAVCIDLTCVMAARERQRDKRTGRTPRRVSWPALVLVGGVVLSLAANLDQAEPSIWGWLTAATPAGAFLVAVSMLERRSTHHPAPETEAVPTSSPVPPSFGAPSVPSPALSPVPDAPAPEDEAQDEPSSPAASSVPAPALVEFACRVATDHHNQHGRPITRDALRARLGVSNQLASDLLRHVRTETA